MTDERDIVLAVRGPLGACTERIALGQHTARPAAVLQPVLTADAVLGTDGSAAQARAARHICVEHHAINVSAGQHALQPGTSITSTATTPD